MKKNLIEIWFGAFTGLRINPVQIASCSDSGVVCTEKLPWRFVGGLLVIKYRRTERSTESFDLF